MDDYYQYGDSYTGDYVQNHQDGELYYDEEEAYLQHLMHKEYEKMANEFSVINECVLPTFSQGFQSVWMLLVLCLVLRCLSLLRINAKLLHICSAVTGFIALWHFYEQLTSYVIFLTIIGYICMANKFTRRGAFLSAVCTAYLLSCEKIFVKEMEWNRVRGSVMVVAMKLISIGFDHEHDSKDVFGFYGYLLNPASVIFGPFISYEDYLQLLHGNPLSLFWIGNVIRTLILSAFCLLWSTCGTTYIIPKLATGIWVDAFKDANGFRFSTYFVSYTSEATCILSGIGTVCPKVENTSGQNLVQEKDNIVNEKPNEDQNGNDSAKEVEELRSVEHQEPASEMKISWSRPVSVPLAVEIPRSLVEVVTNWNLPMHYWLKTYIFKTSRHLGVFPAILITYLASSFLHGLNFQLSIILLSIGMFAYIENGIRKTLSNTFNACIEARRCRKTCTHSYKKGNFWVICINLAFGFLAIWNLAYLGCLFDNDPDIQDKGYSMSHALRKWAALGYICHYFMFGALLVNKLIKDGYLFSLPRFFRSVKGTDHEKTS